MPLTIPSTAGHVPYFIRKNNLPHDIVLSGEYETTDWRDGKTKVTVDFNVFQVGRVVKQWVNQNVRVMSDVWADT